MSNIKEFWNIVPVDDGYHYVCETNDGKWFLQSKSEKFIPQSGKELVFESEDGAQDYINVCLDSAQFKPQKFWRNVKNDG